MKKRHFSRELALQALYSLEITGESQEKVIDDIKREANPGAPAMEYIIRIVEGVIPRIKELDGLIENQCDNWDLQRVALLDKNILRLAITEILYFEDIPVKVSIDEAIELAKKFSTDKSGVFVNGILDPIAFKKEKKAKIANKEK